MSVLAAQAAAAQGAQGSMAAAKVPKMSALAAQVNGCCATVPVFHVATTDR